MQHVIQILPLATTVLVNMLFLQIEAFSTFGIQSVNRRRNNIGNGRFIGSSQFTSPRLTSTTALSVIDVEKEGEEVLSSSLGSNWAKRALLISSFTDGVLASPEAQDFLKSSLVASMMAECKVVAEEVVSNSVLASPCNGPDIEALTNLEEIDDTMNATPTAMHDFLKNNANTPELRLLYIPTAMYALRSDSTNSPGKQRQRARADGKKRRSQIMNHIKSIFNHDIEVLAVTLDLDDGSVKQPAGSEDESLFPSSGKDAFQSWSPHLIYVEGGNTFWLHHCMTKGNWQSYILNACCDRDNWAVYCGKSAGAIIAGSKVETATWKGWDDPSVVPGMEIYADWKSVGSLDMAGGDSFFPHMSEEWTDLVGDKRKEVQDSFVHTLREEEAYCIDGHKKHSFLVRGSPLNES
mmetsp:Transcript_28093/g.39500  ORF Transcript_28093/g.39500 Transcript_28093/m.39500 type:complete len:408 (+) Transcript_28093:129-1352(+)